MEGRVNGASSQGVVQGKRPAISFLEFKSLGSKEQGESRTPGPVQAGRDTEGCWINGHLALSHQQTFTNVLARPPFFIKRIQTLLHQEGRQLRTERHKPVQNQRSKVAPQRSDS